MSSRGRALEVARVEPRVPLTFDSVMAVGVTLDAVRTVSEPNVRGAWFKRAKRAKSQRRIVNYVLGAKMPRRPVPGEVVMARATLVRFGPGLVDSDNLQGAMKAIRDGVADVVGIDDGDRRWTWTYEQERARTWGVRIDVEIFEMRRAVC